MKKYNAPEMKTMAFVAEETIARLSTIPEFVRAYNVEELSEAEFIRYGASQRTLSQFVEAGWSMIAEFPL